MSFKKLLKYQLVELAEKNEQEIQNANNSTEYWCHEYNALLDKVNTEKANISKTAIGSFSDKIQKMSITQEQQLKEALIQIFN